MALLHSLPHGAVFADIAGNLGMKQVLIRRGAVLVDDVPAPLVADGAALVHVTHSLISAGTERGNLESSGASMIQRAIENPGKAAKLLSYLADKGVRRTIDYLQSHIEAAAPTGYSCAGIVLQVGAGVTDLAPGDRVACGGAGRANHAELVVVPRNLVVRVPERCPDAEAAATTVGAIALQGVRRSDVRLGEVVAVVGLGLIGQLTVQLLRAAGARVIGVDLDPKRNELALRLGAEAVVRPGQENFPGEARRRTAGHGADVTLITAASDGDTIVQAAMEATRRKGRVVVVGAVGLGLQRSPFYEKEIDFLISCSYGPGRYDPRYEEQGLDYPYAYVRWTENRNMAEYVRLAAEGQVGIGPLIAATYPLAEAPAAYDRLQASDRPIAVLLSYSASPAPAPSAPPVVVAPFRRPPKERLSVAVVGAGGFATDVHLPNLKAAASRFHLRAVVSATGTTAAAAARRFGADYASADLTAVLADPEVDAVFIVTPHEHHAAQAAAAARAGKAVFLEKPMATAEEELDALLETLEQTQVPFLVGYNRRFSSFGRELRRMSHPRVGPMYVHYRMNVEQAPAGHRVHRAGGRVVGEACHAVDFVSFLVGVPLQSCTREGLRAAAEGEADPQSAVLVLNFVDGSVAVVEYVTVGSTQLAKEYAEVHWDAKSAVLDDYRRLTVFGHRATPSVISGDKGHAAELDVFHAMVRGAAPAIPLEELARTCRATLTPSGPSKDRF